MANKLAFTDEEVAQLSRAIVDMAILWDETMSEKRLQQYVHTLTAQNTRYGFAQLMRSIELARIQDRVFPMPADILQREMRPIAVPGISGKLS